MHKNNKNNYRRLFYRYEFTFYQIFQKMLIFWIVSNLLHFQLNFVLAMNLSLWWMMQYFCSNLQGKLKMLIQTRLLIFTDFFGHHDKRMDFPYNSLKTSGLLGLILFDSNLP